MAGRFGAEGQQPVMGVLASTAGEAAAGRRAPDCVSAIRRRKPRRRGPPLVHGTDRIELGDGVELCPVRSWNTKPSAVAHAMRIVLRLDLPARSSKKASQSSPDQPSVQFVITVKCKAILAQLHVFKTERNL
jgi:hypothetical protein